MSVTIVSGEEGIAVAADRLRRGELVALPTETVYGLGANALDADAVARIFAAKGRPSTNPLIVHVADADAARELVAPGGWTPVAETLAAHFWPGALTLVVNKSGAIPGIVTAGGATVGLRVPDHPVALDLLRAAGVAVAAPSANRSEEVSPTTARHVADSLGPYVDDLLVVDGGPCQIGIESTVLDVTGALPRILRPGMVSSATLEQVVGRIASDFPTALDGRPRSPGQMPRHYAPSVPVVLTRTPLRDLRAGDGYLSCGSEYALNGIVIVALPPDPDGYAKGLYTALRQLDRAGVRRIVIDIPHTDLENRHAWAAIHDRLRRAATPKST